MSINLSHFQNYKNKKFIVKNISNKILSIADLKVILQKGESIDLLKQDPLTKRTFRKLEDICNSRDLDISLLLEVIELYNENGLITEETVALDYGELSTIGDIPKNSGGSTPEADTLQSVTDRGTETTNALTMGGLTINDGSVSISNIESLYINSNDTITIQSEADFTVQSKTKSVLFGNNDQSRLEVGEDFQVNASGTINLFSGDASGWFQITDRVYLSSPGDMFLDATNGKTSILASNLDMNISSDMNVYGNNIKFYPTTLAGFYGAATEVRGGSFATYTSAFTSNCDSFIINVGSGTPIEALKVDTNAETTVNSLILKSNNDKLFRISVDNSGVISATEIV